MTRSSQAEGRSHYVAQQLQQAIYFFSKHVEEVAGLVVDSKKGGTKCMRTLSAQAQGSWALTCHFGRKRTGSKLMAKRAKHCRVEMTFLKRLRHAGARVARSVKTATSSSLTYGADVAGMPTALMMKCDKLGVVRAARRRMHAAWDLDVMPEDARTDPGRRGITTAIVTRQCDCNERWAPALCMTKLCRLCRTPCVSRIPELLNCPCTAQSSQMSN